MAVVNLKSVAITNRDASPEVLNNPSVAGGMVREAIGVVTIGATDTTASTYRFCELPSNARISSIIVNTDAIPGAGSGAIDFGLYDTTVNGGAVVDAGVFAPTVDFHTAVLSNKEVAWGSNESKFSTATKMLWEAEALASDPVKKYDLVGTLSASNSTGAVVMVVKVQYVV